MSKMLPAIAAAKGEKPVAAASETAGPQSGKNSPREWLSTDQRAGLDVEMRAVQIESALFLAVAHERERAQVFD